MRAFFVGSDNHNKGMKVELFELAKHVKMFGEGVLSIDRLRDFYRKHEFLAMGYTRMVFDMGDGWVAKLTYRLMDGYDPNQIEVLVSDTKLFPMARTIQCEGYVKQEKIEILDSSHGEALANFSKNLPSDLWARDLQLGKRVDGSICAFDLSHCVSAYKSHFRS